MGVIIVAVEQLHLGIRLVRVDWKHAFPPLDGFRCAIMSIAKIRGLLIEYGRSQALFTTWMGMGTGMRYTGL